MGAQFENRLFINGQYVPAKTTERLSCYNPATNSLITNDVHVAMEEDVDNAVVAARAAFPSWAATPPGQRAALLLKLADLLEVNGQEIAELETLTAGIPKVMADFGEIKSSAKVFRYYAGWCDKLQGEVAPASDGVMSIVTHEPLGVCAAICPFNAPLVMAATKTAPALAAGNTVIVKSSEKAPLGTMVLGRLFNEAGFPPGVVNILSGGGLTGALMAKHMNVNKISFTGSNATGRKVAEMAAKSNLKRVGLELGGKSPAIIFPDADLAVATEWCVRGITTLTGQICIANSRIYVHKSIREQFLSSLRGAFQKAEATIGDPTRDTTLMGPLVDKTQFNRVTNFIESGKSEATLLYGGNRVGEEGCFITPTLFVDPKPSAKIYKEEIFGPVTVVSEFEDEDDVIARANDTEYGLSAAVFSQDVNRAMRVASKIQSGTVCINCTTQNQIEVPFGGVKGSGWGRENGKYGLLAFTEPKTTFVNLKS